MTTTPTNPRVGLKDIAKAANTSVATVSMALANQPEVNAKTRRLIRGLSRQMGYRRRRRRGEKIDAPVKQMGFMVLGSRLHSDAHLCMFNALTTASDEAQMRLEVSSVENVDNHQGTERVLEFASNLDGLIITGLIEKATLDALEVTGVPYIVFGHAMAPLIELNLAGGQLVTADDLAMGEAATTWLIEQGHQHIGFVCERLPRGLWNEQWLMGYRLALLKANLPHDPAWVHIAGKAYAGGTQAARALTDMTQRPTAFVVPDARVSASFLDAMSELSAPVTHNAIVVSGSLAARTQFELEQYAWIGYDDDQTARVILRQLRSLVRDPMPCSTLVSVPHAMRFPDVQAASNH